MNYSELRTMAEKYASQFVSGCREEVTEAFMAGYLSAGCTLEPKSVEQADATKPEDE